MSVVLSLRPGATITARGYQAAYVSLRNFDWVNCANNAICAIERLSPTLPCSADWQSRPL
jgi:hypothetical protein